MPKIVNLALNEYLYTILFNSTPEQRMNVGAKYAKVFANGGNAKQFATKARLDEKIELLTQMGVSFYMVFAHFNPGERKDFRSLMKQMRSEDKIRSLTDIIKMKVFVTSNKQLEYGLESMAQLIDSGLYEPNINFIKKAFHDKRWDKKLDQDYSGIEEDETEVAKIINHIFENIQHSNAFFRITYTETVLLSHLVLTKNKWVNQEEFIKTMTNSLQKRNVIISINSLVKEKLVNKVQNGIDFELMITVKGISIIRKFYTRIIHNIHK